MPIRIVSTREGFRRCGIPHSVKPTIYPDGRFTDEELKILMEEPRLVVTKISKKDAAQVDDDENEEDRIDYSKMSYNELRKMAKELGIDASGKKTDLIERLEEAEGE